MGAGAGPETSAPFGETVTSGFRIFKDPDVGELVDAVGDTEARRFPALQATPATPSLCPRRTRVDRTSGARRGAKHLATKDESLFPRVNPVSHTAAITASTIKEPYIPLTIRCDAGSRRGAHG